MSQVMKADKHWRDATNQTRNFSGVLFQKTNSASGHHLGVSKSGPFTLQPTP